MSCWSTAECRSESPEPIQAAPGGTETLEGLQAPSSELGQRAFRRLGSARKASEGQGEQKSHRRKTPSEPRHSSWTGQPERTRLCYKSCGKTQTLSSKISRSRCLVNSLRRARRRCGSPRSPKRGVREMEKAPALCRPSSASSARPSRALHSPAGVCRSLAAMENRKTHQSHHSHHRLQWLRLSRPFPEHDRPLSREEF